MLNKEKIELFKKYKGSDDGYYIEERDDNKVISDKEWLLLRNLVEDIFLIRTGVASKSFEKEVMKKLHENCDNEETIILIFNLEKYLYG